MDQLAAIRAFVRVVEAGTFTRAADSLEIPKATLTKLVQQLERHLRTQLLHRTTRRVTVTADGAAYYERVVRLISDIEEIDGSVSASSAKPKGRLRVDVGTSLALMVLIPALPDFHARYPEIQLDLGVTDRPVDLVGENVDAVIRGGELSDQSLIARRIGDLQFITCAAPSCIQRYGMPAHPNDLDRDHPIVGFFSPRTGRPFPFEFERGDEKIEIRGRYIVSVNDSMAYLAAALAGLGTIQAPTFMVQEKIGADKLIPVLGDWAVAPMPLHVVYPPNRHLSNKLRVFVDWIAELFANHDLIQRKSTITR